MKANDFEFDGKNLSDYGFVLCHFGDKGLETVSNGAQITFNTVPVFAGSKHHLINTEYEECLETTVQICKNPCTYNDMEINSVTFRELTRWLCRKKFLKFKPLSKEYIDLFYEAIINVSRIELDGKLVGLELSVTTNSPFAHKEPRVINIQNFTRNGKHSLNDISCEEGYIYPYVEITIAQTGSLDIHNALEDRTTHIGNCVAGEVIVMDYPVIQSSISSHNIQNDFNWNFFRVANTFENSRNDLTISLPCTIKIKYSPIVKVGL